MIGSSRKSAVWDILPVYFNNTGELLHRTPITGKGAIYPICGLRKEI